ncbi:MAG TPA: Holliday junction branch migration protein RuvA, partial [Candidatus Polarisedimenticolaceae bacterium]|nr:Holliday junction branch migration protein RuvA [Candidatus Polarisedimenticolaceae bacterium]
ALAFLSGIGADELRDCVDRQDRARLQRIPGVGRKTADRVLLELRDKLGDRPGEVAGAEHRTAGAGRAGSERTAILDDAVSALVNLGYTRETAARVVERAAAAVDGELPTLEQLLKRALATLAG